MRIFLTVIVSMVLVSPFTCADQSSHRSAAEELLLLMDTDKSLDQLWDQFDQMMQKQYDQIPAPKEARVFFDKYRQKTLTIFKEEFSWEKIKNDYIEIYVETFTEDELKAISEFYKSSAGKIFVQKMPDLIRKSMVVSQKKMPVFMERSKSIFMEMQKEIREVQGNQYSVSENSETNDAQFKPMTREELDEILKSK